jgi:hypothetical protein
MLHGIQPFRNNVASLTREIEVQARDLSTREKQREPGVHQHSTQERASTPGNGASGYSSIPETV